MSCRSCVSVQVVYAYNRRDPVAQQRAIDYTGALKAKVGSPGLRSMIASSFTAQYIE